MYHHQDMDITLTLKAMKLKPIPYQSGSYFIDDTIEPQDGDLVHVPNYPEHPWIFKKAPCPMPYWGNKDACAKIIAQHNLNLEGIPHVDVGEDVEKLAKDYADSLSDFPEDSVWQSLNEGFIAGYQVNKKEFTREQMEKAIDMARMESPHLSTQLLYTPEQIIQSLQPIESIEPETEWHSDCNEVCKETESFKGTEHEGVNVCEDGCVKSIKKYITYQRDGKTFIKAKINYDA